MKHSEFEKRRERLFFIFDTSLSHHQVEQTNKQTTTTKPERAETELKQSRANKISQADKRYKVIDLKFYASNIEIIHKNAHTLHISMYHFHKGW